MKEFDSIRVVDKGEITADDYKNITGEDYTA